MVSTPITPSARNASSAMTGRSLRVQEASRYQRSRTQVEVDVEVDAVGHSPVRGDAVTPLLAPVGEGDMSGQDVPAMLGVGVAGQRRGQLDADLAVGSDADRLVSEAFAGLTVSGEEPAGSFPSLPPLGLGEVGEGQVVAGAQQPTAAPHHGHLSGVELSADTLIPVLEDR